MTRVTHTWDHPRSRGVYQPTGLSGLCGEGSSPLARGLRDRLAQAPAQAGIIPARAGFTTHNGVVGRSVPDHPRSRGVYLTTYVTQSSYSGSSPLARGLLDRCLCASCRGRIIPARAGFTVQGGLRLDPIPDHPRSRGVYGASGREIAIWGGSSPLARGLPAGPHLSAGRRGIIPARAGFTPPTHICLSGARIIPARAGFTVGVVVSPHGETDHPRSRGVYLTFFVSGAPAAGSSPLARGLPRQGERRWEHRGIIPARAGFTRAWVRACA